MALPAAESRTPVAIGDIAIVLTDYVTTVGEPAHKAGAYEVQVVYSDNSIVVMTGDLLPHITPAQITGLVDFLNAMRAQAVTQILGG